MDNSYTKNSKNCANCTFWTGQRTTDSGRFNTKCAPNTYGDCLEGGYKKTHKLCNGTCSKWQIWPGVRQ